MSAKCCIYVPGPVGAAGSTGPAGAQGPPGPIGGTGSTSYGYAYNRAAQTVADGKAVTFSAIGPFNNITPPVMGGTSFTIKVAGDYIYDWRIYGTNQSDVLVDFGVAVNNVLIGGSENYVTANPGTTSSVTGHGIATLAVGDQVSLNNNSGAAIDLSVSPAVNALNASLRLVLVSM